MIHLVFLLLLECVVESIFLTIIHSLDTTYFRVVEKTKQLVHHFIPFSFTNPHLIYFAVHHKVVFHSLVLFFAFFLSFFL
jgi:hypothetical protein